MLYLHRYRSDTGTERNGIENPRSGTFRGFRYTSTKEYDELPGLSSRKSISCYTKKISLPSLVLRSFLFQSSDRFISLPESLWRY